MVSREMGMEVIERSSPNLGPRRGGVRPSLVVLHHTAMRDAEAALARLCDPQAQVSAHWLVAEDGRLFRLVDEAERAWHAGLGRWGGAGDVNSRSIGIEIANAGPLDALPPFPEAQMLALETLLDGVMARWSIPPSGVIAHSDMAPDRKADPGPKLDWRRLARGGRAVWADGRTAAQPDAAAFRTAAATFGYDPATDPAVLLAAFRLRFRPWARGPIEAADVAVIQELAAAHPCVDPVALPT